MMSEVRFLNAMEVASILGVTRQHVYKLLDSGVLPSVEVGKPGAKYKTRRVREDALEQWMNRSQNDRRHR